MASNSFIDYDKIIEIIDASESQEIFFHSRKKIYNGLTSKYEAFNFEFDKLIISDKLKEIVKNSISWNRGYKHVPYTIELDSSVKDKVFEIPAADTQNLPKILKSISDSTSKIFAENTEKINPNFYTLRFDSDENTIIAFTHYSPATVFKGKWIFNKQAEVYEKCLSIKKSIDCLYYKININDSTKEPKYIENIVIFNNKKVNFENIFDYKEDYRAKALLTIEAIKNKKLLSNVDIFCSHCSKDEYMTKKLAKIHQENKIELVHANFDLVIIANDAFEELKVTIDKTLKMIIIPENPDKTYIKAVLSILNTETMENMITKDKVLIADILSVQQKIPLKF